MRLSITQEWTMLGLAGFVFVVGLAFWVWQRHRKRSLKRLVEEVRHARWSLLQAAAAVKRKSSDANLTRYWGAEIVLVQLERDLRQRTEWKRLNAADERELGERPPDPPIHLGDVLARHLKR